MSGRIRRALFSNLSLKVVSLVLAVAIYVLVRPAGPGRNNARPKRSGPAAAAAWRPDAGTRRPADAPPALDAAAGGGRDRRDAGAPASAPAAKEP